jgi:lipid II:glycine glycyltransferase (peptidoglycan interpeptide bridge formation enzyme)
VEDGKIAVAMPMMEIRNFGTGTRGVSLPFSDYCDPLLSENVRLQDVLENAIEYGKKTGLTSLEIRTQKEVPEEISTYVCYFHHNLDITEGEEKLFSRFRASNQRNIRNATRKGVEVKFQTSLDAVGKYYVLHCGTRKMHGLPPQPFSFFRNIQIHILSKGNGFVALAYYRGESIAGGIFFHSGEKGLFKFGASEVRYQELRANNLIMWEALRWYSRNGFRNFSFGRTDPENEGLRNYKRGWGSNENKIANIKYDVKNNKYSNKQKFIYGYHNTIFNHLPIGISKQISKIFYKYMD